MFKQSGWIKSVVVCSVLALMSGCGIKEYFNCRDLCNKKKECGTDSNYNVSNCVQVCSDNADNSTEYARKVDTCQARCSHATSTVPAFLKRWDVPTSPLDER